MDTRETGLIEPSKFPDKESWTKMIHSREFWLFFGTGAIISIAYMDPGNWGTAIVAGASYDYALLWVIWLASAIAMLFQYISGKMGIAGHCLAGLIRERWKNKKAVLLYWLGAEVAVLATDVAEFLGIAVAINLLFGVPLLIAAVIGIFDVLIFFVLTRRSFRLVEYAFIIFVATIGIAYLYELIVTAPPIVTVLYHSFVPTVTPALMVVAVGIIGSIIMPHALFLHSWLCQEKVKTNKHTKDKKRLLRFHKWDTILSLAVAGLINAAILVVAAKAFFTSGVNIAEISDAYTTLTPLFGMAASVVFAVGLFVSGLSASINGTIAGQSIMDSLTDYKISPLVRRVITRCINLVPIIFMILLNIDPLSILVWSQVVLSFLIPLPLIPLIYYTSKKEVMGDLVNSKLTKIIAGGFTVFIVVMNIYLLYTFFF